MADRGHGDRIWRGLREIVLGAVPLTCWLCGRAIDKRLRFPNKWSPTVDLVVPFAKGGNPHDIRNLRPAHLTCNSSRGAGDRRPPRRAWVRGIDTP